MAYINLITLLTAFMIIGSHCRAQDLRPERGRNKQWGYVDKTGKKVISFKYDMAWSFSGRFAGVESNGKWGYIDTTGKEVILPKYDDVWGFSDGLAEVKSDGYWAAFVMMD
jgi:hypothetical protein